MTDIDTHYFVWTQGMRGPTPEKWSEPNMKRNGVKVPALARHTITEDEWENASCAELAAKYPAPAPKTEKAS